MTELTNLLRQAKSGDSDSRDALYAAAYPQLRRIARARLRKDGGAAGLGTTSLVHESYLRFALGGPLRAEDRQVFFAYASQVMRSVIVSRARVHLAAKRGANRTPLTLSDAAELPITDETVLKVHEALESLEQVDRRLALVTQMRYFGGYSEQEIAEALGVTERTVHRDWAKARLILAGALSI